MSTIDKSFGYGPTVRKHRQSPRTRSKSAPRHGLGVSQGAISNGLTTRAAIFPLVVTCIGLCLSTYLSWVALSSSQIAGCGGQIFDCNHVMQSKWSSFLGIPVGVFATMLYLTIASALAFSLTSASVPIRAVAGQVFAMGSLAAGLAAIWFISLQLFVVQHLCTYCLAVHACGLILSAVVLWLKPLELRHTMRLAAISSVGIAILVTGQIMAEAPATFQVEEHKLGINNDQTRNQTDTSSESSILSAPGFEPTNRGANESGTTILFESPRSESPRSEFPVDKSKSQEKKPEGRIRLPADVSLAMIQFCGFNNATILIPSNYQDKAKQEQDPEKQSKQDNEQSNSNAGDEDKEPRLIGINGGKIQLNMAQWPLVGSAKAKHVFVEMFDYTCPHCRQNHKYVKEASSQFGDELAILAISVPMNTDCNAAVQRTDPVHADACEIARLSVAVWRVSPEKFAEFHEWLFSGTTAPSAAQARIQAEKLVGKEIFAKELAGDVAAQYVTKQVELYKMIGAGTVPKLLFTGTTVTGNIGATESLIKVIKQQPTDSQPKSTDDSQSESKNGNDN